jgi:hypothetical protein
MAKVSAATFRGTWGLDNHTSIHAAALSERFPMLHPSSGYRSVQRNRAVGGVPGSWHTRRRAVDWIGPVNVLRAAAEVAWMQRVSPGCTGPEEVLLEYAGTRRQHLHTAW